MASNMDLFGAVFKAGCCLHVGPNVGDYHDEPAEAAFFLSAMDQARVDD